MMKKKVWRHLNHFQIENLEDKEQQTIHTAVKLLWKWWLRIPTILYMSVWKRTINTKDSLNVNPEYN